MLFNQPAPSARYSKILQAYGENIKNIWLFTNKNQSTNTSNMKGQKSDKSEFVTKLVGIIVTIIFSLKTVCKTFPKQYFFSDHLKHKTLNKTTYRTPTANPRLLCTH